MSSPPRDIPTSDLEDVDMQDSHPHIEQSMPDAPPRAPLFLEGTPSVSGTPRHNAVARRAVGLSTPRRQTPLFARESPSMVSYAITMGISSSSRPEKSWKKGGKRMPL
ncbi:hypothetical protein C8Q70DRAFT_945520 [Cubamyces menziesii]|nr:hypothetical protein C8Q70DRAFT_945520 [Cubamyces menziesii]